MFYFLQNLFLRCGDVFFAFGFDDFGVIFGLAKRLGTTARDDLGLLWFALRLNVGPLDAPIYTAYVTALRVAPPIALSPPKTTLYRASRIAIFPLRSPSYRVRSGLSFLCLRSSGHTERKDNFCFCFNLSFIFEEIYSAIGFYLVLCFLVRPLEKPLIK